MAAELAVISVAMERLHDLLDQGDSWRDKIRKMRSDLEQAICYLETDATQEEVRTACRESAEVIEAFYSVETAFENPTLLPPRRGMIKQKMFASLVGSFRNLGVEGGKADISLPKRRGQVLRKITGSKEMPEVEPLEIKITNLVQSFINPGKGKAKQEESLSGTNERPQRIKNSDFIVEENFVEIGEEDIKQLVSLVLDEDEKYQLISICGEGGIGKTTLAKRVYNHAKIKGYFSAFAWVTVTDAYQTEQILQDILNQLLPENNGIFFSMADMELVQKLYEAQKVKRCLIVLDGIRSTHAWRNLTIAFPTGDTKSKILLTTPNRDVATKIKEEAERRFTHDVRPRKEEEAWVLLKKIAFPDGDVPVIAKMEELGRSMVKRCGYLPLAVSVLGGLLKHKATAKEWEKVHHNMSSILKENEVSLSTEIIDFSYTDLPYHLKPFFLYLAQFPEDLDIELEKVHLLSMAECIVWLESEDSGRRETLIDVTEGYVNELAQRELLQVQMDELLPIRRFKSCRLHDLVRSLCLRKGDKEDFLKVIHLRNHQGSGPSSCSLIGKTRRLAIYLDKDGDQNVLSSLGGPEHLRSLLFLNAHQHRKELIKADKIFDLKEFKQLRVLDFDGLDFGGGKFPTGIERLIHLRYLSFKGCCLEELPSVSTGKWRYLQTLDLRVIGKLVIPNAFGKMLRLKHLYLPLIFCTEDGNRLRLEGLQKLEILESFDTSVCDVKDLSKLNSLQKLSANIKGEREDVVAITEYMNPEKSLQLRLASIDISNYDCYSNDRIESFTKLLGCLPLHSLNMEGHIGELPGFQDFSQGIAEISFNSSELEKDPMETLEKLPNLRTLVLRNDAFVGKAMVCSADGFTQLTSLKLLALHQLVEWTVQEKAMPKLTTLEIGRCKKLKVPGGLKLVTALQELKIMNMPVAFKNGVYELYSVQAEDPASVQIPSIT